MKFEEICAETLCIVGEEDYKCTLFEGHVRTHVYQGDGRAYIKGKLMAINYTILWESKEV